MKRSFIFILIPLAFSWLVGCSVIQASTPAPAGAAIDPAATEPGSVKNAISDVSVVTPTSFPTEFVVDTPTPHPTLAPGEWMNLPVVPEASDTARAIYARGLEMGNDPTHFSKVGDCQNISSYFLATYEDPETYHLGEPYAPLQATIDHFQGSWGRESNAVKGGYNVAAVLSPLRADPNKCESGESPLDCELRVWKPSIVIVSMETWWGKKPAEDYEKYMRQVVEEIIAHGAVPILATKADNLDGNNKINAVIAKVANEYDIPLWNFWAAVQPLPGHGLSEDHFHLTYAWNIFDDPIRMEKGWPVRNLTALQAIDAVFTGLQQK